MVKIKQCSCVSEFQDKTYGKNMRVHNIGKETNSTTVQITCTICGKKTTSPK